MVDLWYACGGSYDQTDAIVGSLRQYWSLLLLRNKLVQRYILRGSRKLPRGDVLIIVVVTVVTLLTDLAIAVGVGVCLQVSSSGTPLSWGNFGIQALIFSWQSHKSLSVVERPDMSGDDLKVIRGHQC